MLLFGNKLRLYKFTYRYLSFSRLFYLVILMKRRQITGRLCLWSLWIRYRLVRKRPPIFKLPYLLVVLLTSYWLCWLCCLIIIGLLATIEQKSEALTYTSWSLRLHLPMIIKINNRTSAVTQVAIPIPSYSRVIVHSFDFNK